MYNGKLTIARTIVGDTSAFRITVGLYQGLALKSVQIRLSHG